MKNLNWIELRALYNLYIGNQVNKGAINNKNSLRNHPYIKLLYNRGFIKDKIGNGKFFVKEGLNSKYDSLYKQEFIDANKEIIFEKYYAFLKDIGVDANTTRLREIDIKRLIDIKKISTSEELVDLKNQIKVGRENRQGISKMFFKSSKYIKKATSLETAVLKLLEIDRDEFYEKEDKDKQYIYKLYPKSRKSRAIVLCENLYFLKFPHIVDEANIELWYAGGNNISKIERIPKFDKPILYSCDWDYDGLLIYERAKKLIEKSNDGITLVLLTPNGKSEKLSETEENHSSLWQKKEEFLCGLTPNYYTVHQQKLIQRLILDEEWIEEEGNDILKNLAQIKI